MASQRRREGRARGMGRWRLRRPVTAARSRARKLSDAHPQRQEKSLQHGRGAQQRLGRGIRAWFNIQAITMSIALELARRRARRPINARGTMKLFDKTMSDVNKRAHGVQNLEQVLMNSSQYRHVADVYESCRNTRPTGCCGSSASARKARSRWLARSRPHKGAGGMARHGAREHIHRSGYSGDADTAGDGDREHRERRQAAEALRRRRGARQHRQTDT